MSPVLKGCSVAFRLAPLALMLRMMSCRSPMLRASLFGRRLVANPLRLVQSGNGSDQTVSGQVDNADAVIAEFGHEKSLPLQIDRHVIDPAAHIAERDLGFKLQGSRISRSGRQYRPGQHREADQRRTHCPEL